MSNLEFNKVFAALLVAGIIGMLTGFFAKKIVVSEPLKSDAFPIEVAAHSSSHKKDSKPKGPEPILALLAAADIERGQKLSKACAACHSFDKGGANRIGPNLWNVVNAPKGAHDGFTYSSALMEKGGDWNYQSLNHFLWKPKSYMKGTKMNYIGLKKPNDRAAMIAWLRTLSDAPAALPSQTDIDAEAPKPENTMHEGDMIHPDNAPMTPIEGLNPNGGTLNDAAPADVISFIPETTGQDAPADMATDMSVSDPAALNAIESAAGDPVPATVVPTHIYVTPDMQPTPSGDPH